MMERTDRSEIAVLLLGHGSRAQEANEAMYRVLRALRERGLYRIVEAGFMGLNPPTIAEGAATCVAQGARLVLMVPYFLHTGVHIQQDLPEVVEQLRAEHPNVRFTLGQPLGFHPNLVDVVAERVEECLAKAEGTAMPSPLAPFPLTERDLAPLTPGPSANGQDEDDGLQRPPAGLLRTGYTTGACAAAAAKAAAQALLAQAPVRQVELTLPGGQRAAFGVVGCEVAPEWARCAVIKDAGDDPDATHGAEIVATVSWRVEGGLAIEGGEGVGVVTKRGLELPVGEAAINPVPRQMIGTAVSEVLGENLAARGARVAIAVPRGEEIARKTLNARLGILGGISILGTTGIVVPFSTASYTASIAQALGVAAAAGCAEVVLTTGRRSERFAQALLSLPEECFVQMGDFAGFALEESARRGFRRVTICVMVGKLSKLAAGHFQTHVSNSSLAPSFLAGVAAECGLPEAAVAAIAGANTGRHFAEIILEHGATTVFERLCRLAAEHCCAHVGRRLAVSCIMTDFAGAVLGRASVEG